MGENDYPEEYYYIVKNLTDHIPESVETLGVFSLVSNLKIPENTKTLYVNRFDVISERSFRYYPHITKLSIRFLCHHFDFSIFPYLSELVIIESFHHGITNEEHNIKIPRSLKYAMLPEEYFDFCKISFCYCDSEVKLNVGDDYIIEYGELSYKENNCCTHLEIFGEKYSCHCTNSWMGTNCLPYVKFVFK